MPDGAEFLCISRTLEGPQGAFSERPRRTALLIGCDIGFREEIVYGAALPAAGSREGGAGGVDAGRPGLPGLRAGRLPRPCRAAGTRPLGLTRW